MRTSSPPSRARERLKTMWRASRRAVDDGDEHRRRSLPAGALIFVAGLSLSSFGTGLVLPFTAIYLRTVRQLPTPPVGLILAGIALTGVITGLAIGPIVDRRGAKPVALVGLLLQATGYAAFGFAVSFPQIVVAAVVIGVGSGAFYPTLVPCIASMTTPEQQAQVFSVRYLLGNLTLGLGSLVGGILLHHPTTDAFQRVYAGNAASFLALAVVGAAVLPQRSAPSVASAPEATSSLASYIPAFKHRAFILLISAHTLIVLFGYAQIESSIPLQLRVSFGMSPTTIGLVIFANTVAVVVMQLPIARLAARRAKASVLACLGLVWSCSFLFGLVASLTPTAAVTLVLAWAILFGIGECLFSPAFPPLLIEVAPQEFLGRYSSLVSGSWGISWMIAPALGVWLVGAAPAFALWTVMAVAALAVSGVANLLQRELTRSHSHVGHAHEGPSQRTDSVTAGVAKAG
jgi:MFS family permease